MLKPFGKKGSKSAKLFIETVLKNDIDIYISLGNKGGVGKSAIAWGISKQYNIPYITNDYGSLFGDLKNKFYKHTYLIHDFKPDDFFKKKKSIIVDFKGQNIKELSKEELVIIKLAKNILVPTGNDIILEHVGALKTAIDAYKLNQNILFIASNIRQVDDDEHIQQFIKTSKKVLKKEDIPIYKLSYGKDIISHSMLKDISYHQMINCSEENEYYNRFINDWDIIQKRLNIL
jgi:2-phosphoglycerate kinase